MPLPFGLNPYLFPGGPRRIALSLVACTHRGQVNLPILGWPIVASCTASVTPASYASVKSILETGLDRERPDREIRLPLPAHQQIRGPGYYK